LTGTSYAKQHGFLKDNGNGTWVIGNDVWNMTQDNIYGSKLYYKDGAASNLKWTSAKIVKTGSNYIDVQFDATEAEMHSVIFNGLAGSYHAYNVDKDGVLPPLSKYAVSTKIQDETWKTPKGGYLTKYDWSVFVTEQEYWGVYGDNFGSWYLDPSFNIRNLRGD
ncbi:polysaccharide lyase family 4 protein, partial [Aureobasidium melanogenum]